MSSPDFDKTAKTTAGRARRSIGLCGVGLAAGAVALAAMTPAQAQVATDGVPFVQLQAQVTKLAADLATERAARGTDVAALTAALEAERAARAAADTTLTTDLATERQARIAADSTLTLLLREEENARTAADTTLSRALGAETLARQQLGTRVTALEGRSLITTLQTRQHAVDNNSGVDVSTPGCPSGTRATGGGWWPNDDETQAFRYLLGSKPDGNNGWRVSLLNDAPTDWDGTVFVVCASLS